MRTLVISDPHGCHSEFNELLQLIKYNPRRDDKLILLGDYVDRGPKSKEMVEQIKNLHEEWGVVALRGNHDQMLLDALLKDKNDYVFLRNGGINTIESYCGLNWFENYNGFDYDRYIEAKDFIRRHYQHHIDFIKTLPLFYEDDEHIFVHAGINPFYENWKEQPPDNFLWIKDIFINNQTQVDKIVVFGHTPTVHLHENEDIWFSEGKIGIDGGCCFGLSLNCLEISDNGYKQYAISKKKK